MLWLHYAARTSGLAGLPNLYTCITIRVVHSEIWHPNGAPQPALAVRTRRACAWASSGRTGWTAGSGARTSRTWRASPGSPGRARSPSCSPAGEGYLLPARSVRVPIGPTGGLPPACKERQGPYWAHGRVTSCLQGASGSLLGPREGYLLPARSVRVPIGPTGGLPPACKEASGSLLGPREGYLLPARSVRVPIGPTGGLPPACKERQGPYWAHGSAQTPPAWTTVQGPLTRAPGERPASSRLHCRASTASEFVRVRGVGKVQQQVQAVPAGQG